jgi:hypothetical protein
MEVKEKSKRHQEHEEELGDGEGQWGWPAEYIICTWARPSFGG